MSLRVEELHDVLLSDRVAFGEGDEEGSIVVGQRALHRDPWDLW